VKQLEVLCKGIDMKTSVFLTSRRKQFNNNVSRETIATCPVGGLMNKILVYLLLFDKLC